ncbi:potassium voltage-gated channel subfamily KQT member 4-like isoform X2 [Hydra vulgaris]|uniref:Potassium voltage-gated channel subfamily KQT member 4-like isoform X2 n=1 Tax=Hydra vulgaris TaxID=6087 RepID=A0ABM4CU90_HYDVU
MIIDLIVIVTSAFTVFLCDTRSNVDFLRYARFFHILRLLRMDRTRRDLHTMWNAIYSHRKELLTCYFFCAVILLLGSYVIFLTESSNKNLNGKMNNMLTSLYWGIITFTTIGYGDYTPHTWYGKMVAGFLAMVGCAFLALPAGILGSGFALQVSKQKKEKGTFKVKNPAALLIQCAWRCYAVRNSKIKATWSYFVMKSVAAKEKANTNYQKNFASNFMNLLPKSKIKYTEGDISDKLFGLKRNSKDLNGFEELVDIFQKNQDYNDWSSDIQVEYKLAFNFITIIKLILAARSFSDIRHPYVNMEHVLQSNSMTIMLSLSHLKDIKKINEVIISEINDLKREIKELKKFRCIQRNV